MLRGLGVSAYRIPALAAVRRGRVLAFAGGGPGRETVGSRASQEVRKKYFCGVCCELDSFVVIPSRYLTLKFNHCVKFAESTTMG